MTPKELAMPSVDLEDRGKDYAVSVELPGFSKADVNIEVAEDAVKISAKKTASEEEKNKELHPPRKIRPNLLPKNPAA